MVVTITALLKRSLYDDVGHAIPLNRTEAF